MTDSRKPALPSQVVPTQMLEDLADLEGELHALREPVEADYRIELDFRYAKHAYKAEISRIWERIDKLVRSWPPGC